MPAFRFCPACARPLAAPAKEGEAQSCGGCGATWWRNSKPCAGAILLREGRVLLSKRAVDPKKGEWDLPGGFLDWGEPPLAGLHREIAEETGMRITSARLLDGYIGRYGEEMTLNLVYVCEAEGEPVAADDSLELRWFPLDALPPLAWPHEEEALRGLPRDARR